MELSLTSTQPILSCAMCLGGADGELAIAANTAIGLMLVLLVLVLGSFLGFIFYLRKQSRLFPAEEGENASPPAGPDR